MSGLIIEIGRHRRFDEDVALAVVTAAQQDVGFPARDRPHHAEIVPPRLDLDRLAEDRPEPERRSVAERASAEVDRLALLVDDLLTLASADEHAMVLHRTDVDLDDVVLGEVGALRARGMPVGVSVEPVRVEGDQARLGRVVRNLLENAERHMESAVRVTLRHEGDHALLTVDNDGPPIDPADRERVFGRREGALELLAWCEAETGKSRKGSQKA